MRNLQHMVPMVAKPETPKKEVKMPGLRRARKARGMTLADLSKTIGLSQGYLSRVELGARGVSIDSLRALAKALNVEVSDLLAEDAAHAVPVPLVRIVVRGEVCAGAWRESVDWPEDDWLFLSLPLPKGFTADDLEGRRISGTSMNEVYADGTIVVCCNILAYPYAMGSGDHVIVRRRDEAGNFEITCKELRQGPDGRVWLMPRSDDPAHRAPIELPLAVIAQHDDGLSDAAGAEDIAITGVVVASYGQRGPSDHPLRLDAGPKIEAEESAD